MGGKKWFRLVQTGKKWYIFTMYNNTYWHTIRDGHQWAWAGKSRQAWVWRKCPWVGRAFISILIPIRPGRWALEYWQACQVRDEQNTRGYGPLPSLVQPGYAPPESWYLDSSASSYVNPNLNCFTSYSPSDSSWWWKRFAYSSYWF
jgi:hypothetical protein